MSSIEHADTGVQNNEHVAPASPQVPEAAHIEHGVQNNSAASPNEQAPGAPPPIIIQQPARKQSFAEEVVGYAKVLRQPGTKETGEKILKGEATYNPKDAPQ
ncbi:uncharacterized protein B0H18DRAFT_1113524 [Fomitopsis serialis]|uniref:uncharacterized protein n=1 Tax=Fomitopsis serialis TaxID=139415 RepID=UPI0020087273|nr:uncharacterized protein B0H18DRAFT_1113524 [Neoantrodia serialis]KAH9936071.1 hypothetical protein B0H18DRAFT_1113524 [Neoantrodia serialis]